MDWDGMDGVRRLDPFRKRAVRAVAADDEWIDGWMDRWCLNAYLEGIHEGGGVGGVIVECKGV